MEMNSQDLGTKKGSFIGAESDRPGVNGMTMRSLLPEKTPLLSWIP